MLISYSPDLKGFEAYFELAFYDSKNIPSFSCKVFKGEESEGVQTVTTVDDCSNNSDWTYKEPRMGLSILDLSNGTRWIGTRQDGIVLVHSNLRGPDMDFFQELTADLKEEYPGIFLHDNPHPFASSQIIRR